jgi:hypothetical protein
VRKFPALLIAALNGLPMTAAFADESMHKARQSFKLIPTPPSAVRVVPDVKTFCGSAPGPMNLLTLGAI